MVRLVVSIGVIATVTLALLPFQWLAVRLRWPLRRRIPSFFHRMVCRVLGVRIAVGGQRVEARPLLIVANHVSWLDIAVITAAAPVVFVAKREVSTWPVFGLLARLQRSVFVDRTRPSRTADVNVEIAQRLGEGDPVVLFGEGTSSDGNRVLAFRSALIGAARDALVGQGAGGGGGQVWIQPLSIAYTAMLGVPLGRQNRSAVAWYGDMALWPHLRHILMHGAVDVRLTWGDPIAYDETSDRKAVARRLAQEVRALTAAALRGRTA
jgi:lyso-ornithine lipid O-acyltransferase